MSRLAEVLNVSLSNATGLIDRLEERGFIERTASRRTAASCMVRVTPAGERMLGEVDALSDELLRSVLGRLDRVPACAASATPSARIARSRRFDRRIDAGSPRRLHDDSTIRVDHPGPRPSPAHLHGRD